MSAVCPLSATETSSLGEEPGSCSKHAFRKGRGVTPNVCKTVQSEQELPHVAVQIHKKRD
jgi:hypothetical protein